MALIPVPISPFVDPKNGTINREWYLFLAELFETLGSGNGGSSTQVLHGNNAGFSGVSTNDLLNGTTGQIIISGATLPAWKTLSGDGTLVSSGAITITKTNGTAFTVYATAAVGQLPGTATNDNPTAGNIGEILTGSLSSGTPTALSNATPRDITSVSLTPGDWEVDGQVDYVTNAATTSDFQSGSFTTSATFGPQDTSTNMPLILTAVSDTYGQIIPRIRYSVAVNTVVFLVAQATFSVGTITAYGTIRAHRIR